MNNVSLFVGVIIMIVGRVKYPNSNSLRVVMWAIIISIIVIVVLVVLYIVSTSIIDRVSTSNYGLVLPYRFW